MNQNLSKLGGQLRDIWAQLGAGQRLTVGAATFVLAAGLAAIAFWSSHGDYGLLYGRLSDAEASKVIAALDDAKVPYKIGAGGGSIMVPADKVYTMRMQLAGRGIPQGDGVGFEIFDKQNFGISDFVQRANYVRAVQGELSRTIGQIDEVESARVMIVLPENRLLLDKDKYPTASVFVHVRGNSQLQPQSINSIRFLVANSVEGLKPNHVTVVDNLGNVLSENSDNDSLSGLTSTQLAARRNLEQYLGKKAQDMLEKVLGPGQAIVRVSAEINYDTIVRNEIKFDPDGQVIRSQTKNDENTDSMTATPSGPVGISANTATDTNATQTAAAPVTNSKNRTSTTKVEYEIGKTTSDTTLAPGGIKRLSVAVTVASKMEGAGTDRKVVNRTPEEIDKLRRIVTSAVGIETGTDNTRGDAITLEELPFNDQFAADLTHELDLQQKHDMWWNLARNSVYPVLGLIALVILLRLFKRTPIQEIPIGIPVGRLMAHANGHGNGNGNGNGHKAASFEEPGIVTVEVLNRLIKENPTNMTQAIRDWMNKGRTPEN
ncbi:MAG TPA: flagellar basal-body MS-ring/collar protein FliF [Verrucomicrobiae bacterium]|jgi:flagellar M-ring protein FliF|nr:flagellar basal-body MS-ring/collar protein FliF [Verrucomicrobiae bacterium]